ncbi:hypothetical protein ScPMuIL_018928 [Solemya velum]
MHLSRNKKNYRKHTSQQRETEHPRRKKEKEKDKDSDKEKDKDKDKDREKERSATPTIDKPRPRGRPPSHPPQQPSHPQPPQSDTTNVPEKEKEKEKERSATPTIDKPRPRGRPPSHPPQQPSHPQPPQSDTSKKATPVSSVPSSQESTGTTTPNTTELQKRKRARLDGTVESEETYMSKIEVKVKIPDELKPWLVDDWDLITRQKQLLQLPCKAPVDAILQEYVKFKLGKGNKDAILEVTQGIREYFNVMLGTQLLYKFERPQYGEIKAEHADKPMSTVYGAIHLLRLFVKLGGMLAYTALDEKSVQLLLTHIHDFLKYMKNNVSSLFSLSDYMVAPPDYHRKAI